jgi:hypothetical protein
MSEHAGNHKSGTTARSVCAHASSEIREATAQLSPPTPRDQTVREHHPNQNGSSDGEDQPKCRPGFQAEALKVVKVGLSA